MSLSSWRPTASRPKPNPGAVSARRRARREVKDTPGGFERPLVEEDRLAVQSRVEPRAPERLTSFFGGLPR
jgi:hypothetical protein